MTGLLARLLSGLPELSPLQAKALLQNIAFTGLMPKTNHSGNPY
jgi:hypothetical protein